MKRNYVLNKDDEFYVLKDTNSNRPDAPFKISIEDLKFDTACFYDYVFSGITKDHDIEIKNGIDKEDTTGLVVYKTINEITQGVLMKIKET